MHEHTYTYIQSALWDWWSLHKQNDVRNLIILFHELVEWYLCRLPFASHSNTCKRRRSHTHTRAYTHAHTHTHTRQPVLHSQCASVVFDAVNYTGLIRNCRRSCQIYVISHSSHTWRGSFKRHSTLVFVPHSFKMITSYTYWQPGEKIHHLELITRPENKDTSQYIWSHATRNITIPFWSRIFTQRSH